MRPARPVTWLSSWKVRSAARGSPLARPRSASTTPTSVMLGKLWPLATSCVPMTMSASPLAIASSSSRSRRTPPSRSDDRTMVRASGKCATHLLGDALDAGAAGDQMIERAAFRAGLGPALVVPAMVADELAAKAVLDQPGRADRAAEAVAADAAQRQRRIAAPVEEQQRLLLLLQRLAHMVEQHRRQEAAARRRRAPHVDRRQLRQRRLGEARRKARPCRSGPGSH